MTPMELLAPVGTIETFHAALEGGADAVYVGAPGFNARNMARELSLEEIGAMIRHCHRNEKKFYVAANSLVLEKELPSVVEKLAILEELAPDAFIVQDLGLLHLVNRYFPKLKIHGSTLMTAHNSDGVRFLSKLGCERVVVARELTLKEIRTLAERAVDVELEVFIHGAMCFSYSGLCLFSSYLGGKSGLRGRCVQPCRRGYSINAGGGRKTTRKSEAPKYLFSMNDLSGLEVVPQLREMNVASLKIEGRLRSAHYVKSIVQAYRRVLDAGPQEWESALEEAKLLAEQAMSRNTSSGYFFSPQPADTISPHHSGNMGTHLGRFSTTRTVGDELTCRFTTKSALSVNDRLRLHFEPSGERLSFRLKSLYVQGRERSEATAGEKVSIPLPSRVQQEAAEYTEVYKIDGPSPGGRPDKDVLQTAEVARALAGSKALRKKRVKDIVAVFDGSGDGPGPAGTPAPRRASRRRKNTGGAKTRLPLPWWLKTDSARILTGQYNFSPDRYLLSFEKQLLGEAGKIKQVLGKRSRLVTWALPPVLMEGDLARCRKQVDILLRTGFRSFQLGHISQLELFRGEKVHLFADYTLNLLNSQSLVLLNGLGVQSGLAAIEGDRGSWYDMLKGLRTTRENLVRETDQARISFALGCMVYGAPALYTSRLSPEFFPFDQQILSPKGEPYVIRRKQGYSQTFPEKPFSLLPFLEELKGMGMQYVVVDITGVSSKRELAELEERLADTGRYSKLSTFNYLGHLS